MGKTINYDFVNSVRKARRERDLMTSLGYTQHETDWEIHRGSKVGHIIEDVKISHCGLYVWTKISKERKSNGR